MYGLVLLSLLLSCSQGKPATTSQLTLYQKFMENTRTNFSSCTSFPLGDLGVKSSDSDKGLEEYCAVEAPTAESAKDTEWLKLPENRRALLCYSLFMSVWTVCLQNESKVNVSAYQLQEQNFCSMSSKLSVPHNCNGEHCQALRVIESVIFRDSTNCRQECIDGAKSVLPVCLHLYYAMDALFQIKGEVKPTEPGKIETAAQSLNLGVATDQKQAPAAGQASAAGEQPEAAAGKQLEAAAGEQLEAAAEEEAPAPLEDDMVNTTEAAERQEDVEEELAPPPGLNRPVQTQQNTKGAVPVGIEDTMSLGAKEEGDTSGFFLYFMLLSLVCIIAYLVFHNKQKILALILEGRRHQGSRRRSQGREYRKLNSNLEESMDLSREATVRQVIY